MFKRSRGPFKGPRGPFKRPRGPFKGPRGPFLRVAALWGLLKIYNLLKGLKLVILVVWGAPGAPETLQKGEGKARRPSEMATEAPGTAQTPKTTDFRSSTNFKFPHKVQPRRDNGEAGLFGLHQMQAWQQAPAPATNSSPMQSHGGSEKLRETGFKSVSWTAKQSKSSGGWARGPNHDPGVLLKDPGILLKDPGV